MNQKPTVRSTYKLFSTIALLSLLISALAFDTISPSSAQRALPKSGGGAASTDINDASLIAVGSFDIQYLLLKQTVVLWADGRGDVILQRNIRNVGTASATSATWYFDWSPGEYSKIRAWDVHGPLQFSTSQSGTRIYVTVEFRQPVLPNGTYDFSLAITINNMAYGSGNNWEAYWYTYPGFPVQEFVQGVTFPSNSTVQSIYPTPTMQNLNYLEWKYTNTPANWTDTIDVFYTLSNNIGVPLFLQTNPAWAQNAYGNPIDNPDGDTIDTIKRWGCWMTSAAMIAEYWGQRNSPAFHTNPGVLNTWLRNNKGYDKNSWVIHAAIAEYAIENHVSLYYQSPPISGRNDAVLDDYLLSGNPVIIGVDVRIDPKDGKLKPNHYVVATGKATVGGQSTYTINDPIYGTTTLLAKWNNTYSNIALYSGTPADPRTLRISAHSPVELLVTDPAGRKSGFDPSTNTTWDEIPNAIYTVESTTPDDGSNTPAMEDKYLEIIAPLDGDYTIDVIGTGQGSYEIDVFATDWLGGITKKVYTGMANVGSIDAYSSYFSSYSGVGMPTVPYILRASENPSSADSVDFTAFFSVPVTGVDASDFALTTTGVTDASIIDVSGSGNTYTVTVNTGSGNGMIRLDVVDDDSIKDAFNNPLGGIGAGNGDFTNGETYTVNDWTLIWSDEFNGSSIDTKDWNFDVGNGVNGWGNNELQYYTNGANASVENGELIIQARKENTNGYQYTSTRMTTEGKHEFKYGKIEARMRLPLGQGLWPAFWMLGSSYPSTPWPASGEIDIMEHRNNENKVYGTAHWDDNGLNPPASYGCPSSNAISSIDVTQYHTYSIEWDPNYIRWFVDGTQYCEILIQNSPTNDMEEFRKPFFILLNLAVGGNFPGSPDNTTGFPADMYVDYVRVFCSDIHTSIGGVVNGCYELSSGESARDSYAGVDSGPVKIVSTTGKSIVAGLNEVWKNNGVATSSFQVMALPDTLLSNKYVFPAYNNVTLDEQLRFGNVGNADTTVTVTIGGIEMGSYLLHPSEQQRVNYAGVDSGPVVVEGSNPNVPIVAAIRDAWFNGPTMVESFSQLMGLPSTLLSNKYVFPAYNNLNLDDQLRFGNVGNADTTVTVTIAGQVQGSYLLHPSEQKRVNYPVDNGPVVVEGSDPNVPIIAAIRSAWFNGNTVESWVQLMGLPASQVSHKYLFPAYDNVNVNGQLRFGNIGNADTTVTVTIGGNVVGSYLLHPSEQKRVTYPLNSGPVVVEGSNPNAPIIAALRDALFVNNVVESFTQIMGLPGGQLSDTFLLPAYNNVTLSEELRFGVP